jgi:hypothetical protein
MAQHHNGALIMAEDLFIQLERAMMPNCSISQRMLTMTNGLEIRTMQTLLSKKP